MYEYPDKMDLFAPKPRGTAIVIPVNGNLKKNGYGVMGAGVAKVARKKFPGIERRWGRSLERHGRPVVGQDSSPLGVHVDFIWSDPTIIAFPTKWVFWEPSDIQLIEQSAIELVRLVDKVRLPRVYLPRVGCGRGKLNWHRDVRPMLYRYFDARFHVVYWGDEDRP